ncbi:protein ACCELERATED CELL DEATH 6 [Eutrema salsugineum]|uniref:protein ACCELERATED CELL DEATH 6 n=1 Tax=Eutrema salsugineum TaxID=72664 RepID=UPI000CED2681|nr:protein ACCELERATED CELL DEATH 6 [Eutrema salsugineum]
MESSEAHLDTIESQRSTVVFQDQRRQRCFPMNLIYKAAGIFSSRNSSQRGDTESVPEFLTNLRLLDLFNLPVGCIQMNPETFCGVSDGNKECVEKLRSHEMACLKSHSGDSVLHLAATWGHLDSVKSIVSECPCLILVPNSKDQLSLHVAAYAGHSAVIEALVATLTFVSAKLSEEEKEKLNLYVVKDKDGDTPLHLALKGRYMEIASSLVKANNQASFLANNEGISPLYMAIEAGDLSLVKAILKTTGDNGLESKKCSLDSKLEGRKYLAHAALKARSTDILDAILKKYPSLEDEPDEQGRTCLSFGASIGYYEGVCNLLDRSTKNVYVCDDDGSFPIHLSVEKCSREIVDVFLKRCPDSKHLLNKRGQNILHIAAKMGHHIIKNDVRKILEFGQDVDGNTPLHLATKKLCSGLITSLTSDVRILQVRNNNGLRAPDIAESEVKPNHIFQERLTLALLLSANTKQKGYEKIRSMTRPSEPLNHDKNRDYVNTLLLVAALVATQ